jgi:tetratricopeptide (TPR) repeat protein
MAATNINIPLALFLLTIVCLSGCATIQPGKTVFDYEREGNEAYANGNYDIAVNRYEYLVKQIPKDANFWFKLANSYARNGEPDKAIMAYQNTLLRDTGYAKAWYNLGIIQVQQALKTFIDMQKAIPADNPVRPLAEEKMNDLFRLLGQNPDEEKPSVDTK